MEGNLSGGMTPFGGLDLQGSNRVNHQPQYPHSLHQNHHPIHCQTSSVHPPNRDNFSLTFPTMNTSDQSISLSTYNKGDKGKNSASDEDEPSYTEDGLDDHNEAGRGKKGTTWQRVKWVDKMVKLLITAVSYIGEDMSSDYDSGMRRKFTILQKKGKWKLVSKVMAERGFHVSPQQCEDKFNDLNKRYKRLNDMLGRGTSCQVVENPALLDVIDYLSEKEKDDVRKILSSKHLFYEEMCSYHNGNRLHLPHDPALQRSLQLALRSKADHHQADDLDEDDLEGETDDNDEFEENHALCGDNRGSFPKRFRHGQEVGQMMSQVDMNQMSSDSTRAALSQKHWMESRMLQLEEQKVQIQLEMFELEKQRFKWIRFSKKRDHELEKLRMENERMKLENERMSLELKRKEMGMDFS